MTITLKSLENQTAREVKSSRAKFKELGEQMLERNVSWDELHKYIEDKIQNPHTPDKERGSYYKPGIKEMLRETGFSLAELMFAQQVWDAAFKGDRQAFETVRDTVGQKPSNDVNINDTTDPVKKMSNDELKERIALLKQLEEE